MIKKVLAHLSCFNTPRNFNSLKLTNYFLELFLLCYNKCYGSGSVGFICFVGLSDLDPLVRDMNPDPSIIKQK